MAGSTLGSLFRITTFGESHGKAVGVVIDGVRPNLPISGRTIQKELDRRRPGQSPMTSPRREPDRVEIVSGVYRGRTLGTPICLLIRNVDQDSSAYRAVRTLFRPGHAGYTYLAKYGIHDYRGGGRSSGRETAGRVGAGAIARSILAGRGVDIFAYTLEAAGVRARTIDRSEIERNPMRCPDPAAARAMERKVSRLRKEGDSAGGIVEVVVRGCPPGLGDPVFDKLDATLARALMSIPAVKGVEVGSGFAAARMKGSEHNDQLYVVRGKSRPGGTPGGIRTITNHAGGILGGISNGEEIVLRVAVKPPSSIAKRQRTVDLAGRSAPISVTGRHDPCICPRVVPVVESMVALVLADHLVRQSLLRRAGSMASIRREIDLIDDAVLALVAERQGLVASIGRLKKQARIRVDDPGREKEISARLLALADGTSLDARLIRGMYAEIFRHSREIQKR
jgi:chorismate synthase